MPPAEGNSSEIRHCGCCHFNSHIATGTSTAGHSATRPGMQRRSISGKRGSTPRYAPRYATCLVSMQQPATSAPSVAWHVRKQLLAIELLLGRLKLRRGIASALHYDLMSHHHYLLTASQHAKRAHLERGHPAISLSSQCLSVHVRRLQCCLQVVHLLSQQVQLLLG